MSEALEGGVLLIRYLHGDGSTSCDKSGSKLVRLSFAGCQPLVVCSSCLGCRAYLEGQADLVSGRIIGITGAIIWFTPTYLCLLSPPDPPSRV